MIGRRRETIAGCHSSAVNYASSVTRKKPVRIADAKPGLENMLTRLKAKTSPLDGVNKRITRVMNKQGDIVPESYVDQDEPVQTILLAQAKETTATDAQLIAGTVQQSQNNLDPQYTYDLAGNRLTMTDPTGTTYYAYDALNRLTQITNPSGEVTTYTYDAVGRRTGMTLPNGLTTSYQYDAAGRVLDLIHQIGATNIAAFNYTYDKVGNRTSMTDEYGTHSYIYDQLYRLTQATHPQPANPLENFDYDPVGNRYPSSNVYNATNQLLEDDTYIYSYDKNGNISQKTHKTSDKLVKYWYNAESQLLRIEEYTSSADATPASSTTYTYDGLGRRVAKNVDGVITKYVYDGENILLETDANDNIQARYTHGPDIDEPISMQRNGDNYYYVADALGSIVKLVDAAGNVVNSYVYDSFGNIVQKTEGIANPYTYTGREYDAESGLYYYRFRYYDASVGRFLSEDPIGFAGGINFYTYVGNNPLNFVDPLGLQKNKFGKCVKKCINKLLVDPVKYALTLLELQSAVTFLYAPGPWYKDVNMAGNIAEKIKLFIVKIRGIKTLAEYLVISGVVNKVMVNIITTLEWSVAALSGYAIGVTSGCIEVCRYFPCAYD
jgi:RHS repeat-associated protein